jgi:hypothetical protein
MRAWSWIAVLALASTHALAQDAYVDIERRLTPGQLAEIGLTPAQLERLNRYLREAEGRTPPTEAVAPRPAADAAPRPAPARDAEPPLETARYETPRGEPRRDPASLVGFNDAPIKSRLKGRVSGWEPGTVFELENGQQWKVLKGSLRMGKTLDAPEILVVPGIAGRWFLQVHEDLPKARVYRID